MRREIAGCDGDRLGEQRDGAGAVALAGEACRTIAEREHGCAEILERDLRMREPAVRLRVAVLQGELAVRLFGLPELAARVELRSRIHADARCPAVLRVPGRLRPGLGARDRQARHTLPEFVCAFGVHDPRGGDASALR